MSQGNGGRRLTASRFALLAVLIGICAVSSGGTPGGDAGHGHAEHGRAEHGSEGHGGAGSAKTELLGLTSGPSDFQRMPATYHPPTYNVAAWKDCEKALLGPGIVWNPLTDYTVGIANSAKQGNAAVVGYPALALAHGSGHQEGYTLTTISGPPGFTPQTSIVCTGIIVQLDYEGRRELPPQRVSFLGFGFEPVSATVTVFQEGPAPLTAVDYWINPGTSIRSVQYNNDYMPAGIAAVGRLGIRLSNIDVNGVPLDIQGECQTDGSLSTPGNRIGSPGDVVLVGGDYPDDLEPIIGNPTFGGSVAGLVSIPSLKDCITSTGENLNALLDSAVSGPRNFIKVDLGPPCINPVLYAFACTSTFLPTESPVLSVTHGGIFSSRAPFTLATQVGNAIATLQQLTLTCASSAVSVNFPDADGPPEGALASVQMSDISGCVSSDPKHPGPWTIRQDGAIYASGLTYNKQQNAIDGQVYHLNLTVSGPGGCTATMDGTEDFTYTNPGSVFAIDPAQSGLPGLQVTRSDCPDIAPTTARFGFPGAKAYGTYVLPSGPVVRIQTLG